MSIIPFTPETRAIAAAKRAAQVAEWSAMDLRQDFEAKSFMLAHLSANGVRISSKVEPATPSRIMSLCRRAGLSGADVVEAIGPHWHLGVTETLAQFLRLNPRLPLWAAVALILELAGKSPEGGDAISELA